MKNKYKKFLLNLIVYTFVMTNITGCWNAEELSGLQIVMGLGIDKNEAPEEVLLTAQIVKPGEINKPSQDGGGVSGTNAFWNATSTGESVFDAIRNITHKTGDKLYVSHDEVLIFGKNIASEGLPKYIDFFIVHNK